MPKKFATENPKAVAARERKKNAKDEELSKKQKAAEDAAWKDDDKQVLKKQQRKEELEKKKQQQLERKAEAKALLEKEMVSIKANKPPPPAKVTRAQISQIKTAPTKQEVEKVETPVEDPLIENINRMTIDGEEARSVTEAIAVLTSESKDIDLHPEKRMKAAYNAFEQRRLIELKAENPSLRLSQLKQLIFKEWQKSPENPLNSRD